MSEGENPAFGDEVKFTPKHLLPIPERFAEWFVPMGAHERWSGVIVRGYNFRSDPTPREILHGVYWLCIDFVERYWKVIGEEREGG